MKAKNNCVRMFIYATTFRLLRSSMARSTRPTTRQHRITIMASTPRMTLAHKAVADEEDVEGTLGGHHVLGQVDDHIEDDRATPARMTCRAMAMMRLVRNWV